MCRALVVGLACGLVATAGCGQILGIDGDYGDQPSDGGARTGPLPTSDGSGNGTSGSDGAPASNNGDGDSSVPIGPGQGGDDGSVPPGTDAGVVNPSDGAVAPLSPLLRVVTGNTTVANGNTFQRITLDNPIDPNRAFLIAGSSFSVNSPVDTEVSSRIDNPTDLVFTRAGTGGNIPIRFALAEFQSGVQVVRGATTMSATTKMVTLPGAVDLAHSFPLVTYRNTGTNCGRDDFVRAELTSPNQLTLSIGLASTGGVVEWQVVSFAGATVQSETIVMAGNATSATGALPVAVNPAQTWLIASHEIAETTGTAAELLVSARLASATQVAVSRGGTGGAQKTTYYAVSFTNGTSVQSGTITIADGAQSGAAAATYDPAKSIAAAGGAWQRVGTTAFTNAPNTGFGTFTLNSTSGTQIEAVRGVSGGTSKSNVDYSIVSFF